MKTERRARQTNLQLIRQFHREVLLDGRLVEFKDRQFFIKPLSRRMRRRRAVRAAELAQRFQAY